VFPKRPAALSKPKSEGLSKPSLSSFWKKAIAAVLSKNCPKRHSIQANSEERKNT
jgi:hypothetical protein